MDNRRFGPTRGARWLSVLPEPGPWCSNAAPTGTAVGVGEKQLALFLDAHPAHRGLS